MTTNKKEIKINPELFKMSPSKKDKSKKARPLNIRPTTIKRDLIKRIRERKSLAMNNEDSLTSSVDLFKEIGNEKEVKIVEEKDIPLPKENVSTTLPQPPYSNLKNSIKPTYREWKSTTQKRPPEVVLTDNIREKIKPLNKKQLKHYTKLGKKNKTISVLVKDRATRKNIEKEINVLKKHEISKIKEYLRDHGLIKVGSHAPEHILRETYENAFLTGDVNNVSKENLIHNYMNS